MFAASNGNARMTNRVGIAPYLQAAPFALIFLVFLVVPLAMIVTVSFWNYTDYSIEPAFQLQNYADVFDRCIARLPRPAAPGPPHPRRAP